MDFSNFLAQNLSSLIIGAFIVWGTLLFGGLGWEQPAHVATHAGRMPVWTRLGSSLALVAAAWGLHFYTRESPLQTFSLLMAVGMSLGFVGDMAMARLFPLPEPALGGIAAFGLGHITYILAFLTLGNLRGLSDGGVRLLAWTTWLAIGAAGWYVAVFRPARERTGLHWAALIYALLLASTAGVATALTLHVGVYLPIAVGAALFLLSDLIIAGQLFAGLRFPRINDVIWLTYGPAQCLLVLSVYIALVTG
jgi:hypothetical protein